MQFLVKIEFFTLMCFCEDLEKNKYLKSQNKIICYLCDGRCEPTIGMGHEKQEIIDGKLCITGTSSGPLLLGRRL